MIDLDPAINAAEQNHFKADLLAAELDIARLRALLAAAGDPLSVYAPPSDAKPGLLSAQRRYLLTQTEERRAKIAAIDRQKAQKEAEAATAKANIAKLEATIPLFLQKAQVNRALIGQQLVSKLAYLETEGKLVEQQEELKVQRAHLKEAEAAIAAITETRNHPRHPSLNARCRPIYPKPNARRRAFARTLSKRRKRRSFSTSQRLSPAPCSSLPFTRLVAWSRPPSRSLWWCRKTASLRSKP